VLSHHGEVLCWKSGELVSQLSIKAGEVLQVYLQPVLAQVIVALQLVSAGEASFK